MSTRPPWEDYAPAQDSGSRPPWEDYRSASSEPGRTWTDTATDVVRGVAKGAGSTLYGLGKFFNENTFIGSQTGGYPEKPDELTPEGTAQNVGYGAEQVGEFFIPGGATGQAARVANLGWKGRAALEAASSGAVATAQSGGDARQAGIAAALGATGPLTAKLGEVVAPGIRRLAEAQYGRALNATTKRLKADSARIVPELLDRRVRGSLETLAEKGTEGSEAAGKALERAYTSVSDAGVKSRTAPIIRDLEKVKQRFYAKSDTGEAIAVNPAAIAKVEAMQELVAKFGETARPDQLWAMRKNIDDIIEASGGFSGPVTRGTASSLQRESRTAMQKELNKASPDIKKLNAEFSLWQGLEDVSTATINRKIGQAGIVEFGIRTSVGGGLGLLLGDDPKWGTVGAALGAVTKHPLYRTVAASEKARLAHALSKGQADTAASILSKILAGFSTVSISDQSATRRP